MLDAMQQSASVERAQRTFVRLSDRSSGVDCGAALEDLKAGCNAATSVKEVQSPSKAPSSCSYAASASQGPGPTLPASACPIPKGDRESYNPATAMPASLSNDATADSRLSTHRQASTIPMAPLQSVPHHQASPEQGVWMYPSEQMFFNAMKRKGWDPHEQDMGAVVAIHNTVNERAWREVMVWEKLHACDCAEPRLKKFQGKPNEFSPKARLLNFMGFALPFDRHDWIVDRCGTEVRYVIDFYNALPQPGAPAAMFLDVRPALDSWQAAWDRLSMQFGWVLSGRWRQQ